MNSKKLEILLKELQGLGKECEWVEFKVNNSNPIEIGEYISALSNSACYHKQAKAYLVFGIEDKTHRLVGTNFSPKKEKIKGQELENWIATQLNPRIDFNFYEFELEDKNFVIVVIDPARTHPVDFKDVAYIRIGSYKKKLADHPEKERKIWLRSDERVFEYEIAMEDATGDDVLKLLDYPGYFEMFNLPLPDNRTGIFSRLVADKVIIKEGNGYKITNIAVLLFAKDIEMFESLSRKAVRVIQYNGNNRMNTIKEQIGKKGYAIGFEGLINFIVNLLPTNEIIDKALRKEISLYPPLAIRELVANAIIHQDFGINGVSVMIEIFNNRIEITNPGKPIIDPLRFVDHSPESRNEVLAKLMRRLNVCEERGSGIDKVVSECEYNQLPAPEIIAGDNYTRIILYSYKQLRFMDKNERIRACYLHACLKYVSGEIMTNQSLRQRSNIDDKNAAIASRIIKDTIEVDLIKDEDPNNTSRKYTKYTPF